MVRAFLFQQERVESLFDTHIDQVHATVKALMATRGVYHAKIHYSSSQLTCWFYDDPLRYTVFVLEEALDPGFMDALPAFSYEGRKPRVDIDQIDPILSELKRLRLTDATVYLRAGSINRFNGIIGMNFSCDGSHYIDCDMFFEKLDQFAKN